MGQFLSYSIISGLLMLAMFLSYHIFLSRDNQHGFNRGVLLGIYAVSFLALPVIAFVRHATARQATGIIPINGAVDASAVVPGHSAPVWGTVMIWVFIAGMAVVAVKTIFTWIRLVRVIRSGVKVERDGYTLVLTAGESFAPFSWMRYVVISHKDFDMNCAAITTHELKHISSRHWIDLLIAQIVCVVNWFNPAAWMMRDELMLVHEYQADMAVIESGLDPRDYQMLLIKKAVGARFPSLANSLNHSKLKKRITMMYKEKSGAGRKFKALALVPVLALVLGVVSVPAVRAAVAVINDSDVTVRKGNEKLSKDKSSVKEQGFKVSDISNDGVRTTVVVKGENLGDRITVSGGSFTDGGKTYGASSLNCNLKDGAGEITAVFPFSGDYVNPKMTLTVNGEEISFDLKNFKNGYSSAKVVATGTLKKKDIVVKSSDDDEESLSFDDVTIYLDGKEVSELEMKKLDPNTIASITVPKNKNVIIITSKK